MYSDPIIDELRKYREEFAARFNYDVKSMLADLQRRQQSGSRPSVARPPRRTSQDVEVVADGGK